MRVLETAVQAAPEPIPGGERTQVIVHVHAVPSNASGAAVESLPAPSLEPGTDVPAELVSLLIRHTTGSWDWPRRAASG